MGVNKDQVKGRIKTLEGRIKETAGKVVGNRKLQLKGSVQGTGITRITRITRCTGVTAISVG